MTNGTGRNLSDIVRNEVAARIAEFQACGDCQKDAKKWVRETAKLERIYRKMDGTDRESEAFTELHREADRIRQILFDIAGDVA